jgi:hypothetical protein
LRICNTGDFDGLGSKILRLRVGRPRALPLPEQPDVATTRVVHNASASGLHLPADKRANLSEPRLPAQATILLRSAAVNNVNISVPGVIIGNVPAVTIMLMFGLREAVIGYVAGVCAVLLGVYIKQVWFEKS